MTDTQHIQKLERDVQRLNDEVVRLSQLVEQIRRRVERQRESTQAAVDDLQNSVQLIFKNVHVPGIVYKPGLRHIIQGAVAVGGDVLAGQAFAWLAKDGEYC